jgi:hypothetical protein
MEEKKFPIYQFWATWDQDNYTNNGSGYTVMYKEEPTKEFLDSELAKYKERLETKHIEEGHPIIK